MGIYAHLSTSRTKRNNMGNYHFSEVARSERYFTATLLCHLLMVNSFRGLKSLFKYTFGTAYCLGLNNDFEVVSELDPLRDGSVYNENIRKMFCEHRRIAVPDIFLRWGNAILVIEAKFFTNPNLEDLEAQVSEQKRAIELAMNETKYNECKIKYCTLTITEHLQEDFKDLSITPISWSKVASLLKKEIDENNELDQLYCLSNIEKSIIRAKSEIDRSSKVTYQIFKNFDSIFQKLPNLCENGEVFFGFSEGKNRLLSMTLDELQNRGHYKISNERWSNNWFPIEDLIQRINDLKAGY